MISKVKLFCLLLVFVAVLFVKESYAELTIDPSGNVGIGTTSPQANLEVASNTAKLIVNDTDAGIGNIEIDNNGITLRTAGFGGRVGWGPNPGDNYIGIDSTETMIFENNNIKSMSIDGSGNIGIGTTTPTTKLDISQNEAIKLGQAYLSSGGDFVHLANNEWFNGSSWQATGNGALLQLNGQNTVFYRHTNGVHAESMRIDPTGNVGIGTTSPGSKLSVSGNITLPEGSAIYSDNGGGLTPSGRLIYRNPTTDVIHIGSPNYGNALYIDPYGNYTGAPVIINPVGGNVGIGTTSPSSKLEVKGSNVDANSQFRITTTQGDIMRIAIASDGSTNFWNGTHYAFLSGSGVWTNASDIAYKKDVEDLHYGLKEVLSLKPRCYRMKDTNEAQVGFIAQEVERVIPEVVSGKEGGKGLAYGQLTAVTVNAIKELKAENEQLRDVLSSLTDRLKTVESMLFTMSSNLTKDKLAMK